MRPRRGGLAATLGAVRRFNYEIHLIQHGLALFAERRPWRACAVAAAGLLVLWIVYWVVWPLLWVAVLATWIAARAAAALDR